jgi:hypothetical protein
MMIQFGILFRLGILHDFCDGGIDPRVHIEPTSATQKQLKNCGMLAKMNKGKLEIGAEVSASDEGPILLDRIQETMELNFTITFTDSYWQNYTEIRPQTNKRYFFTNQSTKETEDHILLHAADRVSQEDQIEIIGNIQLEFSVEKEISLLRKGPSEEDLSGAITTVQNKKVINSGKLDEGLYELTVDGTMRTIFILNQASNCQGVMHTILDPENTELASIVDEKWVLQSPSFSAHFKNSSSIWRYHFTKSNIEHLVGLQVTNGGQENLFGDPNETIGPDGNTWILITSNEPIPITEKPTQYLQLKKNMNIENKSEGVVIDRLPVPNKENLYRVGADGSILTDLFINL